MEGPRWLRISAAARSTAASPATAQREEHHEPAQQEQPRAGDAVHRGVQQQREADAEQQ
jgi:hypothetical protein